MDTAPSESTTIPSIQHMLRVLLYRFERGFAGTVLFLASGAVLQGILRAGEGDPTDGTWIYFVWGSAYVITAILAIIRRWKVVQTLRRLRREPFLLALLLYTSFSFLWASDAALTGRRVIIFGGTVLIGVYLAARFSLHDIFLLSGKALAAAGLLSLLAVVFFPEIGLFQDGRAVGIQGVFGNKNTLGRALSLGAAISFFLALDKTVERRKFWSGTFLLLASLVFFSQSKTSLVALSTVLLLVPFLNLLRAPGKLLIPSVILIGGIVFISGLALYANWESFLELLGRGETLSNRLAIWGSTGVMFLERPWLGYGYGADWLGEAQSFSYLYVQNFLDWNPTHAHNGFLQVAFELGIVGLSFLVIHLLRFGGKSVRWVRLHSSSYAAYLPVAFLITLLGANATQVTILSRNSAYWILYVAISLSLSEWINRESSQQE